MAETPLKAKSGWLAPSPAFLPSRVRDRIRAQEEAGEILVGWIQLAIVVGFATVYLLAPKTFSADAPFRPVPWVLAGYFAVTVVRLLLAHRRLLRDWMLYLSIGLDMALLMGMIWSFHLQYGQPPSFYLKAPTLLYVFIFIALRALNFSARYVVTAGAVAAAGWVVLVLYVLIVNPRDSMVTRDYVEYMTSNSVLIGAEVDKVLSILVVTGILGYAILRSRRLLTYSAVESATSQELARFVPSEVAQRIKTSEHGARLGHGETSEATILFLDIEGFTTLAERMSPEAAVHTLNEFFAAVAEPIERSDGVINAFIGDAVLATFNVPRENPDHAANAVRAAREIVGLCAARTFGEGISLRVRVGVNTGTVVGGMVGTHDRLLYTVIGDEVNLAARLETLNKQYGTSILVAEQTRQRAGADAFAFQPMGEVQVRGRSAPTRVYAVAPA